MTDRHWRSLYTVEYLNLRGSSAFIPKMVWFHIFTISNKIVRFQPWDRPLSPWIVWFGLKIVRFDERSSAFARIVCFGPWIVCFRPGSSALILFRIVCFYTQGSSAFDPTRKIGNVLGRDPKNGSGLRRWRWPPGSPTWRPEQKSEGLSPLKMSKFSQEDNSSN